MGDLGREQAAQGAGASTLGAVAAAGGAVAMTQAARTLGSTAGSAHGEEQLIGWVLVGLAGAGALLCLYLALIWGLAAAVLLAGPAGRTAGSVCTTDEGSGVASVASEVRWSPALLIAHHPSSRMAAAPAETISSTRMRRPLRPWRTY